jgi:hypothetical protein
VTDQSPMDLAAAELLRIVTEKEAANVTWDQFVRGLRLEVEAAQHKLDVALKVQDVCTATKPRKTRADKGRKRKADDTAGTH